MRAVLSLALFASAAFAAAQVSYQPVSTSGSIHTRIEGISIPSIPNAPFTAKVQVTWERPLVGGGSVSRKYYTSVARDAEGRVRRESRDFIPSSSSANPPLRSFSIYDPVASTRTTCTIATMSCMVADLRTPLPPPAGPAIVHRKGPAPESLGQQTMSDLPVTGTRVTTNSTVGSGGNNRILISHKEEWYSPDLQMDLSVVRNDPQLGQIDMTVTDLVRGTPDPSCFTVPPGFAVVDTRAGQTVLQ
ncbi:MAG TPA: hypothetical protein VN612_00790 [Acidobacteriaceae bacterium]|nr:hypothetical protein [Acidobacteriaceae bacterium]